jgi:hypothetical protein
VITRAVHAVLGGGHPVRVDGLDVLGVGFAFPARHESCCHRGAFVDVALGDGGAVDAAGGLRDVGQRHHRGARELIAGGVVVDVEDRLVTPDRGQHGQPGLHVDADVAAVDGQRERFGRRQPVAELPVDQQRPDITEGDPLSDQVFDVHAAVAQRAAVLVGFGDFGGEGDDAFEARDKALRHRR